MRWNSYPSVMDNAVNIYDPFSFVQILGYIAMVLGIVALLQKNDTRLKIIMMCMAMIVSVHFYLLGSYVGAVGAALSGTRAGLSIFQKIRDRRLFFFIFFAGLTIVLGILTYQRPLDLLPLIASINGSYAFFYLEKLPMRYFMLFGTTLWLIHNIMALSYGPAIMEMFILSANLITIYRLRTDNKNLTSVNPEIQL